MAIQTVRTYCVASEVWWTLTVWDLFCAVVCYEVVIRADSCESKEYLILNFAKSRII